VDVRYLIICRFIGWLMQWAAQGIPRYDYLLEGPEAGAVLAGGHCAGVRLPQAARLFKRTEKYGAIQDIFRNALRPQRGSMGTRTYSLAMFQRQPKRSDN
jgi:hypothetical protein